MARSKIAIMPGRVRVVPTQKIEALVGRFLLGYFKSGKWETTFEQLSPREQVASIGIILPFFMARKAPASESLTSAEIADAVKRLENYKHESKSEAK